MSKNSFGTLTSEQRSALAQQVKSVRLDRGMKQQELADAAAVSRQTISNLERGTVPQAGVLSRVLEVLGINAAPSGNSQDTEMWLGLLGGMLEQLPTPNRNKAGQEAVQVVASELARVANGIDVPPSVEDLPVMSRQEEQRLRKSDHDLAAKRGRNEATVHIDE